MKLVNNDNVEVLLSNLSDGFLDVVNERVLDITNKTCNLRLKNEIDLEIRREAFDLMHVHFDDSYTAIAMALHRLNNLCHTEWMSNYILLQRIFVKIPATEINLFVRTIVGVSYDVIQDKYTYLEKDDYDKVVNMFHDILESAFLNKKVTRDSYLKLSNKKLVFNRKRWEKELDDYSDKLNELDDIINQLHIILETLEGMSENVKALSEELR